MLELIFNVHSYMQSHHPFNEYYYNIKQNDAELIFHVRSYTLSHPSMSIVIKKNVGADC